MFEVTPNYYKKFKCIADKCKNNCCVGWEIDIDEDTMKMYSSLSSPLGQKIKNNTRGEPSHFVLTEGERCPFLGKNNLCEIMTELGHNGLCEICRLHPRFRNFYDNFYETGLGLCCEEAARIILTEREKVCVAVPEGINVSDEEKEFFAQRQVIFDILQNRTLTVFERFKKLAAKYNLKFEFDLKNIVKTYLSLERLDEKWTGMLDELSMYSFDGGIFFDNNYSDVFEQLSIYFIYRHLSDALYYGDYTERVDFCLRSCFLLGALWQYHNKSFDVIQIAEIARMYSSEIEYSEENMQMLLNFETIE